MKSISAIIATLTLIAISATALAMPCTQRNTGETLDSQRQVRLFVSQAGLDHSLGLLVAEGGSDRLKERHREG